MLPILVTAFLTFVGTVGAGLLLDFIRNGRPKVTYSVKEAVPIELEQYRAIGAYVVSIRNASKRVVKDLECHMQASVSNVTKIKNGGIETPQGLQYTLEEKESSLFLKIPYLNRGEGITATVVAEGVYLPSKLVVGIRSQHDVKVLEQDKASTTTSLSLVNRGFILAASLATVAGMIVALTNLTFVSDPPDVLTFSAGVANLPQLAQVYATAPSTIHFFAQADLVCAVAIANPVKTEIDKYRKFISLTLQLSPGMLDVSRANFSYCRGKLDLMVGDKESAIRDFKQAISESPSTVSRKSSVELFVKDFIVANDLR